jgi:hypothetical protein
MGAICSSRRPLGAFLVALLLFALAPFSGFYRYQSSGDPFRTDFSRGLKLLVEAGLERSGVGDS